MKPGLRAICCRVAAIVALLTTVQRVPSAGAGVVDFIVDEAQSSLTQVDQVTQAGTLYSSYPQHDFSGQGAIGNVTHFAGHLYVNFDVTNNTLQFLDNGPGYIRATSKGQYVPTMLSDGTIWFDWGNLGTRIDYWGLYLRIYDLSISPSSANHGIRPMRLSGSGTGTFDLSRQVWEDAGGYQDLISYNTPGMQHASLETAAFGIPFPIHLAGNGPAVGTWDGVTLTIPFNAREDYDLINLAGTRILTGQLVLHPAVPEPPSVLLLGCGVAALMSCARRARKRRT